MFSLLLTAPLASQERRAVDATTVHSEARGTTLARLPARATLAVTRERGGWSEVTLEGWVSTSLLARVRRAGFDLVVTAEDVRLRSAPNGAQVALLEEGMLLKRVQAREGWTQVRRSVWVDGNKVADAPRPAVAAARPPASPPADSAAAYRPMEQGRVQPAEPQAEAGTERVEIARAAPAYAAPNGAQTGTLQPGTQARVLSRAGDWVRVQTEAWVREGDLKPAAGGALVGVTAAEVRANPERYVGQIVEWRVQYVSTGVADELRPEMPPAQPYLLGRGPLPEPGFVYVMVSREELARVRALPALTELTIRARIRAARTRFLATPVVELISLIEPAVATR